MNILAVTKSYSTEMKGTFFYLVKVDWGRIDPMTWLRATWVLAYYYCCYFPPTVKCSQWAQSGSHYKDIWFHVPCSFSYDTLWWSMGKLAPLWTINQCVLKESTCRDGSIPQFWLRYDTRT